MAISTIKPDGTGDYTTLALWEDALGSGQQDAECYSGGNLGAFVLNDPDPSEVNIYGAIGHRPGITNLGNSNVAFVAGALTCTIPSSNPYPVKIDGLRIEGNCSLSYTHGSSFTHSFRVQNCQFISASTGAIGGNCSFSASVTVNLNWTFQNNVVYATAPATDNSLSRLISTMSTSGASSILNATINAYRNTLVEITSGNQSRAMFRLNASQSAGQINATWNIENNCAFGGKTAAIEATLTGSPNVLINANNNATFDGSADDFGGTGHLINQNVDDWFVNKNNDLHLKVNSPGINAGKVITELTKTMEDVSIPQGIAPDIGADEFIISDSSANIGDSWFFIEEHIRQLNALNPQRSLADF